MGAFDSENYKDGPRLALEDFDLGHKQGLAILGVPVRHAVLFDVRDNASPAEIIRQLRGLADWIEWTYPEKTFGYINMRADNGRS